MAFSFEKKGNAPKKGVGSSMNDEGMAQRLAQEDARYKNAVDSEFWSCLCFKTEQDKADFVQKTGVPDRTYILGDELREATEKFRPTTKRRGFSRKPVSMVPTSSPFENVDYSKNDLEQECIDEAMALLDAFLNVKMPEPCYEATDSSIWICVVFPNREEAERYLDDFNLRKHGDKYIDASAWLAEL